MAAPVTDRFHIEGSRRPRPEVAKVAYADGAGAADHRPEVDIDLSHWVPNRTDERYRADTSTEICLRFAADPSHTDVDLVVNDHADIDGILSLYALLHPDPALAHRSTLVDAAGMGDFHAWPDRPGFELAQQLSLLLFDGASRPDDIGDCYAEAFRLVDDVLEGRRSVPGSVERGWEILQRGLDRLERGEITTEELGERLVGFVYPAEASHDLDAALKVPVLNEIIDESVWLWPEARNRDHEQQVQLVSIPHDGGWFHEVFAPSYCWAQTPGRWSLPGLLSTGDSNRWHLDLPSLRAAVDDLACRERSTGRWVIADELTPFSAVSGRGFPVIASFLGDDGRPAPSALTPDHVGAALVGVW